MPKIVLTGTQDNIENALTYFENIYSEIGSTETIPLVNLFAERIIKELQIKVGGKHKVDLLQSSYSGSPQLIIKGPNCKDAMREFVKIRGEIEKLNLPEDWINPI